MERFAIYCEEEGLIKTLAFERTIIPYIDQYEEKQQIEEKLKQSLYVF